jgi:hypothetical protein
MKAICQIKWIDAQGNPTPDANEATCIIRTNARVEQLHGRAIEFNESPWFWCCADHARRLNDAGMHIWECKELVS